MKKIYLFLSATLIATAGFAQYKAGNGAAVYQTKNLNVKTFKTADDKATGDSLMYFDSNGFYLMDAQDNTDFALSNEDIDGLNPNNAGYAMAFQFSFYNDDPLETPYTTSGGDFFPNDLTPGVDSAFFLGATSWFAPAGTASNWWNFGPITIPANTTGNTFTWFDKSNPAWTDSYQVFLIDMANVNDPAAPSGIVDVLGAGATPVFTHVSHSGSGQPASDTSWTMQSVSVDVMAGKRMFIYFHHQMNDGDVLYLDEMYVTEGNATGVEELNTLSFNVYPNPSTGIFNIELSSQNSEDVNVTVKNVVGQTVINKSVAVSGKTKETISLANYSKGIYFLTIDTKTVKLIVE